MAIQICLDSSLDKLVEWCVVLNVVPGSLHAHVGHTLQVHQGQELLYSNSWPWWKHVSVN